jgi:hypothetical protein
MCLVYTLRVPSLRERLSQATNALLGREARNVPMPMESAYQYNGVPPVFDWHKALSAYGTALGLGGQLTASRVRSPAGSLFSDRK